MKSPIQSFFVPAKSFLLAGKILEIPSRIVYFFANVGDVLCGVGVYGIVKNMRKVFFGKS